MDKYKLYSQMLLIRYFEEKLLELFNEGLLSGTTHTYIGQEANAVSVIGNLEKEDIIFSNHRCHGHYLARFDDPEGLMAEIMGKKAGICSGRGGSQHLYRQGFYTNGVQGGFSPIIAGIAFSLKVHKKQAIAVSFTGDGTLGQGIFYETLNIAALQQVPLLVIVENNRYAQTTPVCLNLAGSMRLRAEAFGMECREIDSTNCHALWPVCSDLIRYVRSASSPAVLIIHTYRLAAHSKGDDYRPPEEVAEYRTRDPLEIFSKDLEHARIVSLKETIKARIEAVAAHTRGLPEAVL